VRRNLPLCLTRLRQAAILIIFTEVSRLTACEPDGESPSRSRLRKTVLYAPEASMACAGFDSDWIAEA
jgi:hypothetical protein